MRYYRIVITDPSSGNVITPPGFQGQLGGATYTSYVNGQTLPGAWNVEFDIPVIGQATPQGSAFVRVWGISLAEIGQARDLSGKNIAIHGGMQKGLPLANPRQSGLLAQGTIIQAFGNWIDTDMTLDLVIIPGLATSSSPGGLGTIANPKNLVLNWAAGTPMADAIRTALRTAFPDYTIDINISSKLVRQNAETGYYPTAEQFAQFVRAASRDINKSKTYAGITVVFGQKKISVFDGTVEATGAPTKLNFQDLIGQPTWIEAPNISIKTVMRADLDVQKKITLPPTLVTNSQQAQSTILNQRAAFQGGFTIQSLRHVGNYRQPSADAWVTVIEAFPNSLSAAA